MRQPEVRHERDPVPQQGLARDVASLCAREANDFAELVAQGAGPQRSAFLSSFFAVVGCHGLHVERRSVVARPQ